MNLYRHLPEVHRSRLIEIDKRLGQHGLRMEPPLSSSDDQWDGIVRIGDGGFDRIVDNATGVAVAEPAQLPRDVIDLAIQWTRASRESHETYPNLPPYEREVLMEIDARLAALGLMMVPSLSSLDSEDDGDDIVYIASGESVEHPNLLPAEVLDLAMQWSKL